MSKAVAALRSDRHEEDCATCLLVADAPEQTTRSNGLATYEPWVAFIQRRRLGRGKGRAISNPILTTRQLAVESVDATLARRDATLRKSELRAASH